MATSEIPPPAGAESYESFSFNVRLLTVMGVVGLVLVAVLGRTFYLQILQGPAFEERARTQQQRTVKLEPRRGKIYDRKGRILAVSVPVGSLYTNPSQLKHRKRVAKQLAPVLKTSSRKLAARLKSKAPFLWIKRQLTPQQVRRVEALKIDGLKFLQEFRRYYPAGELAGTVLGFTGVDSQGLGGLEFGYNRWLHGERIAYVVEREGTFRTRPELRGERWEFNQYALHLTLDSTLQHIAESALRKGVERVGGKSGDAVVLHAPTGKILALANYPDFDPNRFLQYSPAQRNNAAVTNGYEPGSTFKVITVAAALSEGIVTPTQEFFCEQGRFQVADKVIRDSSPHGNLDVGQVIQKSSNICATKIGMAMKPVQFHGYIAKFGFGAKTRAGLPGEAKGMVLPPEKWTRVDHANASFGQGLLASPLQVAAAINVIANEGEWRTPYVVEYAEDESGGRHTEFIDEAGEVLARFGPKAPRRVIDTAVARILTRFMVSVTEQGGTARKVAIPGYTVAGKTGTSQKYDPGLGRYSSTKYWASFVGFVPATQPVLTALVVVDEPPRPHHYGSKAAAPIFREIMRRALVLMDVPPENSTTVVATRPATPAMTVDPATFEAIGMQDLD